MTYNKFMQLLDTKIMLRLHEAIRLYGSQKAFAKAKGISEATLSRILNEGPSKHLKTVSKALGIAAEEFDI